MKWLVILIYTILLAGIMRIYDHFFKEKEKMKEIQERAKKGDVKEVDLMLMNKIMVRRMLVSFILFLPALFFFKPWGDIETPIGTMSWLWWFIICTLIINLIQGVLAWLRRTRGG